MPYSNQWAFEELSSYLYLTFNRNALRSTHFYAGQYDSSFASTNLNYPSIDYFVRITRFADPESSRFLRAFGLWTRYSLGVALERGRLRSDVLELSVASQNSYLALGFLRVGAVISYDGLGWMSPYFGAQLLFSGFRHSGTITGAEMQGGGLGYEPLVGVHFPLFFEKRFSGFLEARLTKGLSSRVPLASEKSFDGGLGLAF